MSINGTDPQTLFGGTWERIQDKFLLSAGTSYKAGVTGGEATHTLSTAEMPVHTHSTPNHTHTINNNGSSTENYFWALMYGSDVGHGTISAVKQYRNKALSNGSDVGTSKYTINTAHNHSVASSGGGTTGSAGGSNSKTTAHNNMPPYLAVYVWKRTV